MDDASFAVRLVLLLIVLCGLGILHDFMRNPQPYFDKWARYFNKDGNRPGSTDGKKEQTSKAPTDEEVRAATGFED